MTRTLSSILVCILCLAAPADAQSPLSPDEIIDYAIQRARRQLERRAELEFESVYLMREESLSAEGEVEETETLTYRRYPLEGAVYEELLAKDGKPLDTEEARREADRRREFIEEVRKRRAEGLPAQPEEEDSVTFDREFVSRYRFTLVGEEDVGPHRCWILDLEPREGELPVRRRIDHALNNATGTVWISQDDFGVARVEFEMAREVTFWGGILGRLRNTVGRLEFDRIAEGVWLPRDMNIFLDLRILFRNIRRRLILDWQEYAPLDPGQR